MCSSAVKRRTSGGRLARMGWKVLRSPPKLKLAPSARRSTARRSTASQRSENTRRKSRVKSLSKGLPRSGCARLTTARPPRISNRIVEVEVMGVAPEMKTCRAWHDDRILVYQQHVHLVR